MLKQLDTSQDDVVQAKKKDENNVKNTDTSKKTEAAGMFIKYSKIIDIVI